MQANVPSISPLVSILINNHNYGQFLADAIDSALSQTYPYIEVIVVDDGSTDNSAEVIASYENRIIPVRKQRGGQASAFNAGFAASQGEIICFLDADDVYLPDKVEAVVRTLKNYQESYWIFHMLQRVEADLKTPIKSHYDYQDCGQIYECDLQTDMRQGSSRKKMPFSLPATSGLCFTRALLSQILPMPEAEGITLNDSYLQFAALFLAKGFALAQKLSLQRVHSKNLFTGQELIKSRAGVTAKIHCFTAYFLKQNFSSLSNFTDKFFAVGLSAFWHLESKDKDVKEIIKKYFSITPFVKKISIYLRSLFYYMKYFYKYDF